MVQRTTLKVVVFLLLFRKLTFSDYDWKDVQEIFWIEDNIRDYNTIDEILRGGIRLISCYNNMKNKTLFQFNIIAIQE